MKARSNGPASAGSPAANASSAGALTTVIRSSRDPRLAPPAAGEVGPLAVGVDGHDRPVGRLAERHPQRRVAVRRPDLDDPPPAAGERRRGPGRCRGRRSGCPAARRPSSIAASAAGERAPPATRSSRGRRARGSSRGRSWPSVAPPSDQQAGAEVEAGREDRAGRDRADVDVRGAPSRTPSTGCGPSGPRPTTRSAGRPARRSGAARRTAPTGRRARRTAPTSAGPAPVATQAANSTTWSATTDEQDPGEQDERRLRAASGVTRYQWPRIIAAKTPPIAAVTTASWVRSETVPSGPPPQASAPKTSVAAAGRERRPAPARAPAAGGSAARRGATTASTQKATSASAPRPVPGRVHDDRRVAEGGRQGAVGQPGEDPEADRTGRGEARDSRGSPSVRRRSRTTAAYEPSASPVRTVQLMNARFSAICAAGTSASVAGVAAEASTPRQEVRPMALIATRRSPGTATACVEVRTPGGKIDPHRPVVRQSAQPDDRPIRSSRAT